MTESQKCPSCGGAVRAYQLRCELCGHEFSTAQVPSSVRDLAVRLGQMTDDGRNADARKAEMIRNWPIPVSSGDLLEFVTFAGSQAIVGAGRSTASSEAWRSKAREAIAKGRIAFREGDAGLAAIRELEQRLAGDEKVRLAVGATRGATRVVLIVVSMAALLVIAFLIFAVVF